MGNEVARERWLALADVLAPGCTTTVVNLAVDDGGAKEVSVAVEDADGASSIDFDVAYDAGVVALGSSAHYVRIMCCPDGGTCAEGRLGGPDDCYPAGEWKLRAYDYCMAQGGQLVGYDLFGACPTDAAP